jgi:lipoprotein-anchoring transpeptidase ErfK/SrfK
MELKLSRRDILKLGGLSILGLGFRDFPPGGDPATKRPPSFKLGRTIYSLRYYESPSFSSKEIGYYVTDTIVNIYEERIGDPEPVHNPIWLRTEDGWLHSSYVQPVYQQENDPVWNLPAGGILVEVTAPYSQAYIIKDGSWKRSYRFYCGSTYWVHSVFKGINNSVWYQVYDDRLKDYHLAEAKHMRPIQADEVTPISAGVLDKRIDIYLEKQRLVAYEDDLPVYTARIATGYFEGDTPQGEFRVERKQPTRHMASSLEGSEFDLPGVPWVCYISWTGVSLHGTYWHNNYGTPQSHGCINLSPKAAKWIYRWTEPFVPVNEDYVESDIGTRVVVY